MVGEHELDAHVLAHDALDHLREVDHDDVEIELARLQHLLAAEREQLAHEVGRAIGRLRDAVE